MIDMEAGAKVAGSRFAFLKGDLVFLELALVRWTLEILRGHGFEPVVPPVLVREEALFGTGFLPDTEQQIYRLADDPLYLTGTSEVPLASLHAGEIMDEVPRRYAGFSPCFRREAGAAGKDTRGIFRVHQFDKVEMFSFVEPSESVAEHERLLAIEEEIWQGLEIPYQVVNIAVDDLGSSAVKKYDIEAWLPSQQRYREVTSTSNTTDFQSRRLDIRYRPDGGKPEHVHTLNGTAVAVSPRADRAAGEPPDRGRRASRSRRSCTSGARLSGWVELEGAANARDVGAIDGVAPGVLLRSDNLQGLTPRDVAAPGRRARRAGRRRPAHERGGRARGARPARRPRRDPPPLTLARRRPAHRSRRRRRGPDRGLVPRLPARPAGLDRRRAWTTSPPGRGR